MSCAFTNRVTTAFLAYKVIVNDSDYRAHKPICVSSLNNGPSRARTSPRNRPTDRTPLMIPGNGDRAAQITSPPLYGFKELFANEDDTLTDHVLLRIYWHRVARPIGLGAPRSLLMVCEKQKQAFKVLCMRRSCLFSRYAILQKWVVYQRQLGTKQTYFIFLRCFEIAKRRFFG